MECNYFIFLLIPLFLLFIKKEVVEVSFKEEGISLFLFIIIKNRIKDGM
jgi:hypothetical protein